MNCDRQPLHAYTTSGSGPSTTRSFDEEQTGQCSSVTAVYLPIGKAAGVIQLIGVTKAGYAVVFDWLGLTAALGFTLSLVKVLRSLTAAGLGLVILNQLDRRWSAIVGAVRSAVSADLGGGGFA